DDIRDNPEYHSATLSHRAGMRALLVTSIFVEGEHFGGLVFFSRTPGRFTRDDALVARRLAHHVTLALSHQRLAEQAPRNADVRARAEKIDLIDETLASVLDGGDLQHSFDRVSSVVQKVLPHDAIFLAVRLPDGKHAKVYASCTSRGPFPETVDVPPRL